MTARLLIDAATDAPLDLGTAQFEIFAWSQPSPARPDHNEDTAGVWLIDGAGIVLAVADGMGGTPLGADASTRALKALDHCLTKPIESSDTRAPVLDAFERANREIMKHLPGSGTTLVVAGLVNDRVRTYNVGDSLAMLVGQRGRVRLETIAHSPVGYGVAAGLIAPDTALEHDHRHYLSNHVGHEAMHIDLGSHRKLAPRDTLLLASDGLIDNMTPDEIIETIRCGPLDQAAEALARCSVERMQSPGVSGPGKPDDLTFILLRKRSK